MNTEQFDGHTAGPWWIEEVSDNGNKDTWLMGNFPQNDMLFCMEWTEGNDADLRLIAAAPDLLAEVKRLREERVRLREALFACAEGAGDDPFFNEGGEGYEALFGGEEQ